MPLERYTLENLRESVFDGESVKELKDVLRDVLLRAEEGRLTKGVEEVFRKEEQVTQVTSGFAKPTLGGEVKFLGVFKGGKKLTETNGSGMTVSETEEGSSAERFEPS